jgi:hypothetical protein
MSTHPLNPGDRVHVLTQRCRPHYLRGDRGTITAGPHQFGAGRRYYFVEMDKDASPQHPVVVFNEEEIELDA